MTKPTAQEIIQTVDMLTAKHTPEEKRQERIERAEELRWRRDSAQDRRDAMPELYDQIRSERASARAKAAHAKRLAALEGK